jgi:hypothetical protein
LRRTRATVPGSIIIILVILRAPQWFNVLMQKKMENFMNIVILEKLPPLSRKHSRIEVRFSRQKVEDMHSTTEVHK